MMSKRLKIVLVSIMALIALGVALYPMISNVVSERYKSVIETEYKEQVREMDDQQILDALAKAGAYNQKLSESAYNTYSREAIEEAMEGYEDCLNLHGDGLMGYVDIPKIKCNLPIYHGTTDDILAKGVGHLIGSALPVGGEHTHCVLTSHSGLSTKKLFTDLDTMAIGDVFYIHVLGSTIAYKVSDINVVLPEDITCIQPEAGKDYCTLITCTPYGVNTHRLLVRGERIEFEEAVEIEETVIEEAPKSVSTWVQMYTRGILAGIAFGIVVMASVFIWTKRKTRRSASDAHEEETEDAEQKDSGEAPDDHPVDS